MRQVEVELHPIAIPQMIGAETWTVISKRAKIYKIYVYTYIDMNVTSSDFFVIFSGSSCALF